ncbi:MAG: PAS domain-containing sensor histidine kinase [Pseudomonadota bacterium]
MPQVLNSLVVSEQLFLQRGLEDIMLNNIEGYHPTFTTQALNSLSGKNHAPELIFIENTGALEPEELQRVIRIFPGKIYVVIDGNTEESRRRTFLKAGADEVMSLAQLQSGPGRHLLEKLLTFRKQEKTDDRIEESEERFRGIIENARDVITLLDEEGTIIYNSRAFERLLGYESWEVLGQSFFDLVHAEDRSYIERQFRRLTRQESQTSGVGEALEFRFRHKEGRWRIFEAMVSNLLKDEFVRAVVLNSRDVTEHRESEIELEKYRSHLEELVDRRTRELTAALEQEKMAAEQQRIFVSMVSHEFRTPLTIIDGNAQIIQRRGSSLSPEILEKRTGTIRLAVDRLVRLIETVLSAHMLESGKMTVSPAPCDLADIIRSVCDDHLDAEPRHEIRLDIREDLPDMLLDEKVIRQMMMNLLSNAVKYSPQNPLIEVSVRPEGNTAVIQVTDHGVGIPENELPKIFTRYFRASTSGGIPGSGLGLSFVKQFVELHGGKVEIQSGEEAGTTVTVRLPVKTEEDLKEGRQ